MMTLPRRARPRYLPGSIHLLAVVVLLLAGGVLWKTARPTTNTLALAVSVAVTGLSWWSWSRASSPRAARRWSLLLATAALSASFLNDSPLGLPVFVLGLCSVAVEYGRRGVLLAAASYLGVLCVLYTWASTQGRQIPGGIALNIFVVTCLLTIGLLVAESLRQLTEAHRDALLLAEERRRTALRELDRALAEERMTQARALHDDVGRDLTAILMSAEVARRLRDTDAEAAWAEIDRVHEIATDALTGLRRQVRALSPLPADDLDRLDLDSALERLTAVFQGTGLDVVITRPDDPGPARRVDPLAYRIIQEGLTNVVRHSGASRVEIVHTIGDLTTVRILDDGENPSADPTGANDNPGRTVLEGFGLSHLRSRVEAAGGTLTTGWTGRGFLLDATYPAEATA
ncbi:sensor histidine kinase [Austwickia chelonae]|nr:histidine kinase [Austwickia chelonae]